MAEELLDQDLIDKDAKDILNWHPNGKRLEVAKGAFIGIILAELLSVGANYYGLHQIEIFETTGDPSGLDSADSFMILSSVIYFLMYVATAIVYLQWLRRAYYNTRLLSETEHSDGWAVGMWFIPILSLFKPYQIVRETYDKCAAHITRQGISINTNYVGIMGIWWGAWVIANIAANISLRAFDLDTLESIKNSYTFDTYNGIFGAVTAVLALVVLTKFEPISRQLERLYGERY